MKTYISDEHPLILALKLKVTAIRSKADPEMIANLEKRIQEEAHKSLARMGGKVEWINDLSSELDQTTKK